MLPVTFHLKLVLQFLLLSFLLTACKGADGGYAPGGGTTAGGGGGGTTPVTALMISPTTATLAVSNTQTFTASGGLAPYRYTIFTGSGSILSTTGNFTAPGSAGFTTVRVTDALGSFADAIVTTNAALRISPTSQSLTINGTLTFTATGGVPPLTYTRISGTGTVTSAGAYTAPSAPGTDIIRVRDAKGNSSNSTVSIFAALGISPSAYTMAVNNTTTFSAAGGSGPYTFSLITGTGSVNATTGIYTAPASAGTATVRVTDSLGASANANITINNALTISPTAQTTFVDSTITFTGSDGVTPYTFSIVTGTGSINSSSGEYTAPSVNGTATVRITDAVGNTADANVIITSPMSISPTSVTLAVNNSRTFTVTGGTAPFVFSRLSGTGTVNSSTGVYTAPATSGSAVVEVSDSLGATATANVTVNAALAISPTAQTLMVNSTLSFSGTGGVPPYSFSLLSGTGSIDTSTGLYTAPAANGTAMVMATDSLGNTSSTNIIITSPMNISPASATLAVNNTQTFTVTGGTGPFSYSLLSGTGSINSSTGVYTAPASTGSAVVRVTDSLGATSNAAITINAALGISPTSQTTLVNSTINFSGTGGVTPYAYSVVTGTGSVNSSTGVYTAPASNGTATVRVTDAVGNVANSSVIITSTMNISPSSTTLAVNNTQTFTVTGGTGPFSYSLVSGTGSINSSTGVYTAPASTGSAVVRVTDSLGATSNANVTVNAALGISPTSQTILVNSTISFSGTGGVTPYTFSVVSGTGSVNSTTGLYTAPASNGSATVRVTDAVGNTANSSVTITSPMFISPGSPTLAVNNTQTFTVSGGTGPYTYSRPSGTGTINSTTGVYTAPATSGTATVRVTDSLGATNDATVTVNAALAISPTSQTMGINGTLNFSSTGGVVPYAYSITSGSGSVNASTGVFTAPASPGTTVVRVTDSYGNTVSSTVTVTSGLSVSPASATLAVGNTVTFAGANGATPYTYAVTAGTGSINATTGVYTAPGSSGTATVRVTDNLGATANASVTINPALAISPATKTLAVLNTFTFSATGGVSPYTYSIVSGGGSINSTSGAYTAPASSGSVTVRVTDGRSNVSNATVTINPALAISPTSVVMLINGTQTFTGSNGVSPYTFSIFSGGGSINASTGVYTAPSSNGSATIRIEDSFGNTADAAVTITSTMSISPASTTIAVNNTTTFTVSGGTGPYSYSVVSGTGTVNSSTGVYTAPASSGSATVRVTDSLGATSNGTVTVNAALAISPTAPTLMINATQTFTGTGGVSPYSFSVISGTGTVNATTGVYTAPSANGTATVRITDSLGNTANASVTVTSPMSISPSSVTLAVNNARTFTVSGGTGPYTYTVFSGTGTVGSSTGIYTAPASSGSATVRVTDSLGATSSATVTVNAALAISPTSQVILTFGTQTFTGSNGVSPYTFAVTSGTGTIDSTTGVYTAPASNGSATVQITDSLGNTANASVTVTSPMNISPSSVTLAVNNTRTFTVSGGTGPYTYSVFSGTGTVNSSSGVYTAPSSSGSATVRVTDSLGATSSGTVTVNAALAISPSTATISSTGTQTFTASGGVSPFSYSIVSGPGSINSTTGLYTGASAGSVTVRVTDSLGNTSDSALTVNGPLSVSPTAAYVVINSDLALSAVGGVSPYTYSIVSGGGTIDTVTGIYTAPATTGSATLRTTDSAGTPGTADTAVTIYNALTLSPTSLTIAVNGTQTFTTTGGIGTRTFSIYSGTGTINSTTGAYVAGAVAGTDLVQVTDTIGNVVQATVTVVSQLSITPPSLKLPVFSTATFGAVLGTSPYTYSVSSGTGSVNSSTGVYTAASTAGAGGVTVTDLATNTATALITHVEPTEIVSGSNHSCVRYSDGSVKCWGLGSSGQLGNGGTTNLGDTSTTLGGNIPFVNLGTGRTATAIAAGYTHSCALLDNASIKCWGQNTYGQLGIGNQTSMGSAANQMGDSLPAVNLGSGRTASKVFAFGYTTCAVLDNSTGKCWGQNTSGQLGQGDIVNRGVSASQMGDSLAAINVGAGLTPTKFVGGLDFTCALLNNSTVKCFGGNRYGQLGQGSTINLGDGAGEMAALAAINLGTGRTAIDVAAGYSHACAILDNGTAKCWGRNNKGQLAIESTSNSIGASAGQMGDSLIAVPFTSFTPTKIFGGNTMTCFMNSAGALRCFGLNTSGQLLVGSTATIGRSNNDVSASANINMGTSITATSVGVGFYTACAITNNKRVKCWGSAGSGAALGGQTANNLGDVAGELGDSLPYVNH